MPSARSAADTAEICKKFFARIFMSMYLVYYERIVYELLE